MKNQHLMDELDKSVDNELEKAKLMEGFLGYIISSTQVLELKTPHITYFSSNKKKLYEFKFKLKHSVIM